MSTRVTRDEIDGGITNLVFDYGNRERPPWRCCSNTVVPRSQITIFVQVSIIVLMISLCFAMSHKQVILTNDRIFMAVVGPSGSGKTDLIFNMLQGRSFYPAFLKIYYFYKEFQDTFTAIQQKIPHNEFIKFSGLDITKKMLDSLLVYDDSCEEIFNDKEFVKIATSGRQRKLHVIYIKHNLFQQSKWSRTTDLNTTHIVLFKSLRDIQQIEYLGKQLNCLQLLKDAYKLATAQPYGHLIIELDPKTSQSLQFSSQLIGP